MAAAASSHEAPPEPLQADAAVDDDRPLITRFNFEAKIFAMPRCYFEMDSDGRTPCFFVPMGGVVARVPIRAISSEFNAALSTADLELLSMVERALEHVARIRPGDSIPSEILDGTASWSFDPEHEMVALGRLMAILCRWAGGEPAKIPARGALPTYAASPFVREEGPAAKSKIATAIGSTAEDVTITIEDLAREIAYVEALRDHFAELGLLPRRLELWRQKAADDRNRREEYDRMIALTRAPLNQARQRFQRLDKRIEAIDAVLRDPGPLVAFLRKQRDLLHADTRKWRHIAPRWKNAKAFDEDERRRSTYRFLAENFAEGSEWSGGDAGPGWGFSS